MTNEPPQRNFGRARPAMAPDEPAPLDFASLRGGEGPAQAPRWMLYAALAILLALLAGGIYFVHATLAFKAAVNANVTTIYGPYPPFALVFVIVPVIFGILYFVLDYFHFKTGVPAYASPRGIAILLAVFAVLAALSYLPVSLIRHGDNGFARAHGYVRCASPFDPQHVRVYAEKTYVDMYGCPTVTLPQ